VPQACPDVVPAPSFRMFESTFSRAPITLWLQAVTQTYPASIYPVRRGGGRSSGGLALSEGG
jgi:hypothetical protein